MEGALGEDEQSDPHQTQQRAEAGLETAVSCSSNFQVHQELERLEPPKYATSMECASGQAQAILGKIGHHVLNKEEDIKVRKRQKTLIGPQTHGILNASFAWCSNGQELPGSTFVHNFQSSSLDPKIGNHHDVVRQARSMDYSSIHPGDLTLQGSTSTPEQSELSQDCKLQDGTKCTVRNNISTQGNRAARVQADHNSSPQGCRPIGLRTDHCNNIQGSRTTGLQTNHSTSNMHGNRMTGLQADHSSSIPVSRKTELQPDHSSSNTQGSRTFGLQSNHNGGIQLNRKTGLPADHSRTTGPHADRNSSLIQGSRVTGLYAELVKELEAQVTELRNLLATRDEASAQQDKRIKGLEQENQQLKSHMRTLEEQNDLLSSRNEEAAKASRARMLLGPASGCIDVTESNIQFLKGLVGFLETNARSQANGRVSLPPLIPAPEPKMPPAEVRVPPFMQQSPKGEPIHTPVDMRETSPVGMLRVSGVTGGFQYWMNTEESSGSPAAVNESCALWEETIQETLPDGTPAWASPVEENGRPKLELIPNSGVYITHHQLDDLSQISNEKPKLMTRRLLDYFFSRETLARSSATGQRIAHNNTTMEKPIRLPVAVVGAIKEYVTNVCGRGCNFNAVINSKCGTSRRSVKKMSIRLDWMEGGGQHCPRTEVTAEGSLSPYGRETAVIQNFGPHQGPAMPMDNPAYS